MPNILSLEKALANIFHYSSFRTGQREIIEDVLRGEDVLGVLPTGSGKSICYQLPALLMDGLTIVVSPLISLMIDQVNELKVKKIKRAVALNSFVDFQERMTILKHLNDYKLIYVSPEILQQELVISFLKRQNIALFVIDEAHCISQWGHDFRPDYLKLSEVVETLNNPPILALSATATPEVQADIIQEIKRPQMTRHIFPMDRNNITFVVEKMNHEQEKLIWLSDFLKNKSAATLIYFSSKKQAEKMAVLLSEKLPNRRIAFYHGGMETTDRISVQQQFMINQLDVICCTSAFGMGINKPDIRTVIHYHFPSEIESYIQESGRAGRDGNPSLSITLYDANDLAIPRHLIQNELPTPNEVKTTLKQLLYMQKQGMDLLVSDTAMSEQLQLSEIKWRFLRFHFEKHDMIYNNQLADFADQVDLIYDQINHVIIKRTIHKVQKLEKMVAWLNTEDCLRQALYKDFQTDYKEPLFQCCSRCGVDLSKWELNDSKKLTESDRLDWRKKLQTLLLGDEYEAK